MDPSWVLQVSQVNFTFGWLTGLGCYPLLPTTKSKQFPRLFNKDSGNVGNPASPGWNPGVFDSPNESKKWAPLVRPKEVKWNHGKSWLVFMKFSWATMVGLHGNAQSHGAYGKQCTIFVTGKSPQIYHNTFQPHLAGGFSPTHLKNMRKSNWIIFSK